MPGLSQLKKFSEDMLSLGNEPALRAARGERPVTVPIPKGIADVNDGDDFLTGMPEVEPAAVPEKKPESVVEDFSDITGTSSSAPEPGSTDSSAPAINLSVPDLSSLGAFADDSSGTEEPGVPDLSMFMEPEEEVIEEEPEEKEVDIADMGLEALLGGAGFDGSEGQGEYSENEDDEGEEEPEELKGDDFFTSDSVQLMPESSVPTETDDFADSLINKLSEPEDLPSADGSASSESLPGTDELLASIGEDFGSPTTPKAAEETPFADSADTGDTADFTLPDDSTDFSDAEPLEDLDLQDDNSSLPNDTSSIEDFDLGDLESLDSADFGTETTSFESDPFAEPQEGAKDESASSDVDSALGDLGSLGSDDSFGSLDELSLDDIPEAQVAEPATNTAEPVADDFDVSSLDLGDLSDIPEMPDTLLSGTDDSTAAINELGSEASPTASSDDFSADDLLSGLDLDLPNSSDFGDISATDTLPETDAFSTEQPTDFTEPLTSDFSDISTASDLPQADDFAAPPESDLSDIPSVDSSDSDSAFDIPENPDEPDAMKSADFGDIDGLDLDVPDFNQTVSEAFNDDGTPIISGDEKISPEAVKTDADFAFDGDAIDLGEDLPESVLEVPPASKETPVEATTSATDELSGLPDGLFDASDIELPEMDSATESLSDFGSDFSMPDAASDDFSLPESSSDDFANLSDIDIDSGDLGESTDSADFSLPDSDSSGAADAFSVDDFSLPDSDDASFSSSSADSLGSLDSDSFGSADLGDLGDSAASATSGGSSDSADSTSSDSDDFPSGFDFNLNDMDLDSDSSPAPLPEDSAPPETFDTSAMEGLDFGIPDTDSHINEKGEFDLGSSDDFGFDGGDFEIPGFSDVQTVEVNKNGKIKVPTKDAEPQEQTSEDGNELPPNTLSDAQYEKFLKNLSAYPLNVRMAVEELFAKNEFTDDAEFSIVQKVLKKVSARQLASELEKMLDIAIPVPRDFERRTAEEYEAYKSSFQYQLKNKIIPGAVLSVAAIVVCFFLFQFANYFVYRPLRANSLYKQGYKLLEAEDFPLSETKFSEATRYDLQKKWFFRYARSYREHKQYIRAEQMFTNLLRCFKQDKQAGLEFAQMEIDDLANYEKAEQILLREVLDYHINDPDGILLLGDNYLEWATEKDSSKYEDALRRYSELIQLYGQNDVNMSRMLRYYIRTDNLLEVLQLKQRFFPRPKSLSAQDWTELSGYCLDKLYGYLSPSDEYLRSKIEDVKEMLVRAVKADKSNPLALYNLSKYYVNTKSSQYAKETLRNSIQAFNAASSIKKRDLYKYIDSYRLLGELYSDEKDYIKALESFTNGVTLFSSANKGSGLEGTAQVGKLYSDIGDIEYFVAGEYDRALSDYEQSIGFGNDNGELRYKVGYIQYSKKNYSEAVGSFLKASEDYADDPNLLLAMGNTLSLRNDNYAAQGYYQRLINQIDKIREQQGILFPQLKKEEYQLVNSYMKASNNLGVTLHRLALRTGSSAMNAQSMVQFQESLRAWDALTRNQETLVRLGGSNLAEQNLKYVTHPMPNFEPAIYTDIPLTLEAEEEFGR